MNKETTLREFEKWASKHWSHEYALLIDPKVYLVKEINIAWESWQAALSTRPTPDKGIREALEEMEKEMISDPCDSDSNYGWNSGLLHAMSIIRRRFSATLDQLKKV